MAKWEYSILYDDQEDSFFTLCTVDGGNTVPVEADGTKGDRNHRDAGMRLMARLGLDGWEMVAITQSDEPPYSRRRYFKRQISESITGSTTSVGDGSL